VEEVDNYIKDFKKVTNSVLLVAGEYDRITPTYLQKKILKAFPNILYKEYAECGHVVFMERPKEFFSEVIDFINK
jgi:pimeloyl-ACP methyl ester carboxylesterase